MSLLLYAFFQRHSASLYAAEVLRGLKAASVGLIMGAAAAILMLTFFGTSVFGEVSGVEWPAVILCGLCFFVLRKWKVSPILMLAAARPCRRSSLWSGIRAHENTGHPLDETGRLDKA